MALLFKAENWWRPLPSSQLRLATLLSGARDWVATAAPTQRTTVVTTTTTTVVEEQLPLLHHLGEEEWDPRFVRAERQARVVRNFGRIAYHYWKWQELLSFCGSVLAGAQHLESRCLGYHDGFYHAI